MKRRRTARRYFLGIAVLFSIFILVACNKGTDEKTTGAEETETDYPPMMMLNGKLYKDTGYINSAATCGTMDGEILTSVEGTQKPTKDKESNFGTGYEYQLTGDPHYITIVMDEKWHIFQSLDSDDTIPEYVAHFKAEVKEISEERLLVTLTDIPESFMWIFKNQDPQQLKPVALSIENLDNPVDGRVSTKGLLGKTVDVTLPNGTTVKDVPVTEDPDNPGQGIWSVPTDPLTEGQVVTATQTEEGKLPSDSVEKTVLPKVIEDPTGTTPEGYVRITFDATADGNIAGKQTKTYDVVSTLTWAEAKAEGMSVPTPVYKDLTMIFDAWTPALPAEETAVAQATYTAVYKANAKSPAPSIDTVVEGDREITGAGGVTGGTITVIVPWNPTGIKVTPEADGTWSIPVPTGTNLIFGQEIKATQEEKGKLPSDETVTTVLPKVILITPDDPATPGVDETTPNPDGDRYVKVTLSPGEGTFADTVNTEYYVVRTEPVKTVFDAAGLSTTEATANLTPPTDNTFAKYTDGANADVTDATTIPTDTAITEVTYTAQFVPVEQSDTEQYTPIGQDIDVNLGEEPVAADGITNKDELPADATYTFKDPVDTSTPGEKDAIIVVTYPDETKDEVPIKINVVDTREDKDKYDPKAQGQTVELNATPDPEKSIANTADMPEGTTYAYKKPVDTSTVGDKGATVIVTYPDKSTEEVIVIVTVVDSRPDTDKYTPEGQDITVDMGEEPVAADGITNKDDLPDDTTYEFKEPVDTTTPGEKDAIIVVTYPDETTDEVPIKINVVDPREDKDKYDPVGQGQTVGLNETPDAIKNIANVTELPAGTTFAYKTPVDTSTVGDKDAIVVVTYPDRSTEEVPVVVTVVDTTLTADKYVPEGQNITVNKGEEPKAEDGIANKDELPADAIYSFKEPVDTSTTGPKLAIVVVTYADESTDEVPIIVNVIDEASQNNPIGQSQTVKVGETPDPEKNIANVADLPEDATYSYKTPVDTTTPGDKAVTVVVTYKDGSKDEVPAIVKVEPVDDTGSDAEQYDPEGQDITVGVGEEPKAEDGIANKDDLPDDTTYEFKEPVDTTTPGEKEVIIVVTYPDESKDEVPITVTVVAEEPEQSAPPTINTPKAGSTKVSGTGVPGATVTVTLPDGTKVDVEVGDDGRWNLTVDKPLREGDVIRAIQTEPKKLPSRQVFKTVKDDKPTTPPTPTDPGTGGTDDGRIVDRIEGPSRYDTAVEVSKENYDRAKVAIIVNGHRYPDALTATVLADLLEAPILLVELDAIPDATREELRRLGVTDVIIVGGPRAVSEGVEEQLRRTYDTERIGGYDRYETASLVADRVTGITGNKNAVVIARGDDFPDALSISALAIKESMPILLVRPDSIPEYTQARLDGYKPNRIYVAGLTLAVSQRVEDQLKQIGTVTRLGGNNRYETSTVIAAYTYPDATRAIVASGEVFIDALSASPLSDEFRGPILLVRKNSVPQEVKNYLAGEGSEINHLTIIGGTLAISEKVEQELK